jgi:hypothetical protein
VIFRGASAGPLMYPSIQRGRCAVKTHAQNHTPGLRIECAVGSGVHVGRKVTHSSPQGSRAHSLPWSALNLQLRGIDPATDGLDWLTFSARRGGMRRTSVLHDGFTKWLLRSGKITTASPRIMARLSAGDQRTIAALHRI